MQKIRSILIPVIVLVVLGATAYWVVRSEGPGEETRSAHSDDSASLLPGDASPSDERAATPAIEHEEPPVLPGPARPDPERSEAPPQPEAPAEAVRARTFPSGPPPEGTSVVAGHVVDAESGRPLAGARIEASPTGGGVVRSSSLTGDSGEYRVEGLAAGAYDVRCSTSPPGYPPLDWADTQVVNVADGAITGNVDFALHRGVAVRGRVVDAAERPVADAAVTCKAGWTAAQAVHSGADGRFLVNGVDPARRLVLIAEKEGLTSPPLGPLTPTQDGLSDLVLVLDECGTIAGRVVDASGGPVMGVYAVAEPVGEEGWEQEHQRFAKTDASGAFRIVGLCPTAYGLFVHSGEGEIDMLMTFKALASNGDDPAAQEKAAAALREVVESESGEQLPEEVLGEMMAVLKESLKEEAVFSRPHGSPFGEAEHEQARVEIGPGQTLTGVTLVFGDADGDGWAVPQGGSAIAGGVVDPDGNPIPDASISANGPEHAFITSDEKGAFRLAGLPDGAYSLTVCHQDFADTHVRRVQAGTEDVEIVMQPYGSISGRVVDARSGMPVTTFQVGFKEGLRSGNDPWETRTSQDDGQYFSATYQPGAPRNFVSVQNDEGRFELHDVPPGSVTLFVRSDGYALGYAAVTGVLPAESLDGVIVKLSPGAGIKGRVVTAAGNHVPGAFIFVNALPDRSMLEHYPQADALAVSDKDGAFALSSLPQDISSVWAYKEGFAPGAAAAGQRTSEIVVTLSSGAVIRGTVTLDGEPLADEMVSVHAYGTSSGERTSEALVSGTYTHTSTDGTYEVSGIRPGNVDVFVSAASPADPSVFRQMTRAAVVAEGMETVVDLELAEGEQFTIRESSPTSDSSE